MMKPSTERDYRRRIARVVEAILLEPGAHHTLESLAAVAHLSPFHFHRVYRALTGESVVETVQPHVDRERIGAVGFSLGGYTVLEPAGARTNLQAFERFCTSPEADAICHPPEAARISDASGAALLTLDDLSPDTRASRARSAASYRDPRVKAVFAMAPVLGEAFDSASFADVTIPVSLMAGEADVTAPVATNIHRIAGLLHNAHVELVPGASHYTFMDTCLADVVAQLAGICQDGPGVDRDAVHALAADRAIRFFAATLPAR